MFNFFLQKFTAIAYIKNIQVTVWQRTLTTDINDMIIENLHTFCSVTFSMFSWIYLCQVWHSVQSWDNGNWQHFSKAVAASDTQYTITVFDKG